MHGFKKKILRTWLGPPKYNRLLISFMLAFTISATGLNIQVRLEQFNIWEANKNLTEFDSSPTFSTADAPHFLAAAKFLKSNHSFNEYFSLRLYPNNIPKNPNEEMEIRSKNGLMLAELIAFFSPSSSTKDLLNTAHYIGFVSAGLTTLMIIFAFGAAGYWLEGTVAALGGCLSESYLVRSSFGRIDTDQLNLGLMYLMLGLVVMAGRSKTNFSCVAWSICAGFSAYIFLWWYGKAELIWIAFFALAWLLIIIKRKFLLSTLCLLIFYFVAMPSFVYPTESVYLQDTLSTGSFIFPNTHTTITEVAPVTTQEILLRLTGSIEMSLVCILGLILCAIRHPILAVAYAPLVGFALLNFVIGNRAIFYTAPIMWFGAAFAFMTATRYLMDNFFSRASKSRRDHKSIASVIICILLFHITWVSSPTKYYPKPTFSLPIQEGLASLKNINDKKTALVATWWDYGYASMFLNGLPTLHDGGSQTTPTTYFVARSLLDPSQKNMVSILRFLGTNKREVINRYKSSDQLLSSVNRQMEGDIPDIYLVLTGQMANWITSISVIGNWDIDKGKPILLTNEINSSSLEYLNLNCVYRMFPQNLNCENININLTSGTINGLPELVGWSFAKDGFVDKIRSFEDQRELGLQTLSVNKKLRTQIMRAQLYYSAFNQLFHLGDIKEPNVTLVYDDYPHIRIFKISGKSS